MKRFDSRIVFGLLLIFGGALALANGRGWLTNTTDVFIGGAFLLVGLSFLLLLFGGHWWAAFPGFTLASIGVLILLPPRFESFGGAIVLGGVALSFWCVYVTGRAERWWALIPAGVLTTLAVVTIAADRFGEFQTAGFFFLGLALTFLLVALLAGMKWAYWPALVLGVMGFLGIASLLEITNYVWAIALIAAGAFLLFRYFSNR
jgi:hypothetical protein